MTAAWQRLGRAVAWIEPAPGQLYPPDLQQAGVQLAQLWIIRPAAAGTPERGTRWMPQERGAGGGWAPRPLWTHLVQAAEIALGGGGFALVVVDWSLCPPALQVQGERWQMRLQGLVRRHGSTLLLLSRKAHDDPALGALVALRLHWRLSQGWAAAERRDSDAWRDTQFQHSEIEWRLVGHCRRHKGIAFGAPICMATQAPLGLQAGKRVEDLGAQCGG